MLRIIEAVAETQPKANMPRVEFPAAELKTEIALDAGTPQAVEIQDEYVYLFLTEPPSNPQQSEPNAKIPLVPSLGQTTAADWANAPNPLADAAPLVIIIGMYLNPYLN